MHVRYESLLVMIICLISTCTLEHLNEFHFIHRTMTWHLIISILGAKLHNFLWLLLPQYRVRVCEMIIKREGGTFSITHFLGNYIVALNMIALNFKEALNWIDRRELRRNWLNYRFIDLPTENHPENSQLFKDKLL